jgi:hypothetical protein
MPSTPDVSQPTPIIADDSHLLPVVDGEAVTLPTDAGMFYRRNWVGTSIWELGQEPYTLRDVCREVAMESDPTHNQCRDDIYVLIARAI